MPAPATTRSIFVTGAYGLLGSWLVKALLHEGAEVTVLRRDTVPRSALTLEGTEAEVNIVPGDVCDAAVITRALTEYGVDTVFHLAAQTLVGVAKRSPISTFEANIRGTWTVLEACRAAEVGTVVVASSDKAYGAHAELPYTESHALNALYPYDVSKAATDMIARSYAHTYGLPVAVTRFANLYGGGDFNVSRLVPECVAAALAGRAPVIRSDGTLQRDFLYVRDAVDAYLAIAGLLARGQGAGEAFNAGGDRAHTVLEVAELICELAGTGTSPDVRGTGVPAGEIPRQWVDSTKLRTATGWAPRFDLRAGLAETLDWYRSRSSPAPR